MAEPYRVEPGIVDPTHHILLTDGNAKVGLIIADSNGNATPNAITRAPINRTALKTATGNQQYSDFEPPWSPITQNDWSGGRGKKDFDEDATRYWDATGVNTRTGRIFLGPQLQLGKLTDSYNNWPGNMNWLDMRGASAYIKTAFTAATAKGVALKSLYLFIRRRGTPANNLTVTLHLNSNNSLLATATVTTTNISDTVAVIYDTGLTYTVTNATAYYIKITSAGGTAQDCWQVGYETVVADTDYISANGSDWTQVKYQLYYQLHTGEPVRTTIKRRFLSYKHQLYELYYDGTATTLRMNGDRGVADSNSADKTKLIDATKTWTNDEWIGSVVHIVAGPGQGDNIPWRVITDNDGTSLTVSPAWTTTHTTATEYVIVESDKWTTLQTWNGVEYSDVEHMTYDVLAIANGPGEGIRYYKAFNNSGKWTEDLHVDYKNQAIKLQVVIDKKGTRQLWKANIGDPGDPWNLSFIDTAKYVWDTDPTFGSEYNMEDEHGNVNGLVSYGDTAQSLWTMRDGMVQYQLNAENSKTPPVTYYWNVDLPLPEIGSWYDSNNGRATLPHGVYLYFSYGQGIERYYNKQLDDVGPNRDDGLPANRQGNIMSLDGYPGSYFCVIDAGETGYSSIMQSGSSGWQEVYRAPYGVMIYDIKYQTVQGIDHPDRLWIAQGSHYFWLPFPSTSTDHTKDDQMLYTHEGAIELGYMYATLYDVYKLYYQLKVFSDNLASGQKVEVDYRLNDDTAWIPVKDVFDTSPVEEHELADIPVTGRRIQIRLRLMTNDATKTPYIKAVVMEAVARVAVKYAYSLAYRAVDQDKNLLGDNNVLTAEEMQDQLDQWAEAMTPLRMYSLKKAFNDKVVYIDPQTIMPYQQHEEAYTGKLVLTQLID